MFNLIDRKNKLVETQSSLTITYPRKIQIIFGNYPFIDHIHNLIIDINNNLSLELENFSHVKGQMTEWNFFNNNNYFIKFINYIINKHQNSNPEIFEYFYEKYQIKDSWGNKIKQNDHLNYHRHPCLHGILYLTKGCDLYLPELNLKITPEVGDYYILPPEIIHGFNNNIEKKDRYSLVFNIYDYKWFNLQNKINKINARKKI